jgi:4-hydroxyacetophenone monooxygenase
MANKKTTSPSSSTARVAVIGAGVSGIAAAYRLQQAGVDFSVYEKNEEVGGVWWENRYPGCRLDTPNFAYSLSFGQKQDWTQHFSQQPDIIKYLLEVVDLAGIRPHIRCDAEVQSLTYNDKAATWTVSSRNKAGVVREEEFHFVITAMGLLNRPSIPDFKGLDTFQGALIHSHAHPTRPGLDALAFADQQIETTEVTRQILQLHQPEAGSTTWRPLLRRLTLRVRSLCVFDFALVPWRL